MLTLSAFFLGCRYRFMYGGAEHRVACRRKAFVSKAFIADALRNPPI
jgi:hypothetical protein